MTRSVDEGWNAIVYASESSPVTPIQNAVMCTPNDRYTERARKNFIDFLMVHRQPLMLLRLGNMLPFTSHCQSNSWQLHIRSDVCTVH